VRGDAGNERAPSDAAGPQISMQTCRGLKLGRVATLGCATQLLLLSVAWGQASTTTTVETKDSGALQEIIVTAQKREQNLQDIGVQVTAIGAEGLQELGHQNIVNLTQQVPNLQAQQYSPVVTVFNIRGISQNDVTNSEEAPVAFYNDGAYISALGAIAGQTFDLERVEVLEGPQGTLFGRNTTGGAIQVISAKPTKDFEGYASVTGGSFSQASGDLVISGPFTDSLRGRLALTNNYNSDYVTNAIGPGAGNNRFWGTRAQLEADVGTGTLLTKVEYMGNDQSGGAYTHISAGVNSLGVGFPLSPNQNYWNTCPGCDAFGYKAPSDPFTGSWDYPGFFKRRYWNTQVQYDQPLSFAKLTSITNYQNLYTNYAEDSDVSPNPVFNTFSLGGTWQASEEVRLAGDTGRNTWLVGVYGLKIHSNFWYGNDGEQYFFFDVHYGGFINTSSWALFGQDEYKLNDVFSLVVGSRFSSDVKKDYFSQYDNGGLTYAYNPSLFPQASQTFNNWQGKFQLNVRPNANTLLYIGANRGTKAGGFNTLLFPPASTSQMNFNQEVLWDYEAGFKLTLADNRVTFNGAAFHYQYHDYQAYSTNQFTLFVTNHPAEINGLQLELAARPIPPLKLSIFATNMYTERVDGVTFPAGQTMDTNFPQDPKVTFGTSASYEIPIQAGTFVLATNWKYNSSQYFSTFNAPIDLERPYTVGSVRVSFKTKDEKWEIAGFVNNVTDRFYRIFDYDNSATLGSGESVFAPPRWYGGQLTYRF
jgi:iron complex outermembrane recepter protein